MADVHNPSVRSYNMSQVKGKNTRPELAVRKFLHSRGFRFNLHGNYRHKKLPGKPDIILPKYKTVIFVNGCFWHGHKDCRYSALPKTRTEFWRDKISSNIKRDQANQSTLSQNGWRVTTVWQCELKPTTINNTLSQLEIFIRKGLPI